MRHRAHSHSFSRRSGPRKALIRGLVYSLVEHGRIRTTVAKAKELRKHVEKAITLGKKGDVATRRLLASEYPNPLTVKTIVDDLSVRFKTRPGGYTRVVKLGPRPGDMAEMAIIEFVDYKLPEAASEETVKGEKKSAKKAKVAKSVKSPDKKKKTERKTQSKARKSAKKTKAKK